MSPLCRESAPIREIFCSVQGEGPYVGARQAFVRFFGCNLNCKYCDTDFSNPGTCDYEKGEGSGSFEKAQNPISALQLKDMLQPFKNLHSVSLTGGEPLLHTDFIEELDKLDLSAPLYLESNMTLPEQARKVKDRVAYVAGDFKLPEALGLENPEARETREAHIENTIECFRTLRKSETRDCFCKIVVSRDSDPASVVSAVDAIAGYVSCVILQPETRIESPEVGINTQSSVRTLIELQSMLLEKIDTRIIPQTHRMWGCL
ncbi:7-carboxy-7-deazaguanine synthase QueE [Methanosarcina sp. MTP4]|uniref:7-carboxy-7-deazaguanine synthase QueE n=1 Tax=Methanosarcina sp. MTP4 TaxID=1434100 RepID=UPI00064ED079